MPTTTTAPTVDDVLACTHVGGHWHEWNADGGTIRLTRAELRPALEAAYDPSMPDWPATVEIDAPTYEIQVLTPHHGWIASPEYLGYYDDDNRWATVAEAQTAINELVALGGFDANKLRIALAA